MAIEVPPGVQTLFLVLTGEKWPQVNEDHLREVGNAWGNAGQALERDLAPLMVNAVQTIRANFTGKAAIKFAETMAPYVIDEPKYIPRVAAQAQLLKTFLLDAATQVEYVKIITIGELVLLIAQIAWAIAMAYLTAGESLLWLEAQFKIVEFMLETWWRKLILQLLMAELFGIIAQLLLDVITQAAQFAKHTRHKWDTKATISAVEVGAIGGALSLPFSAIGHVVAEKVTKVIVKNMSVDSAAMMAAIEKAIVNSGEKPGQISIRSLARSATVELLRSTEMPLRVKIAAVGSHALTEMVEEGLHEALTEGIVGAVNGQGFTFNPFAFTSGVASHMAGTIGDVAGHLLTVTKVPETDEAPLLGDSSDTASEITVSEITVSETDGDSDLFDAGPLVTPDTRPLASSNLPDESAGTERPPSPSSITPAGRTAGTAANGQSTPPPSVASSSYAAAPVAGRGSEDSPPMAASTTRGTPVQAATEIPAGTNPSGTTDKGAPGNTSARTSPATPVPDARPEAETGGSSTSPSRPATAAESAVPSGAKATGQAGAGSTAPATASPAATNVSHAESRPSTSPDAAAVRTRSATAAPSDALSAADAPAARTRPASGTPSGTSETQVPGDGRPDGQRTRQTTAGSPSAEAAVFAHAKSPPETGAWVRPPLGSSLVFGDGRPRPLRREGLAAVVDGVADRYADLGDPNVCVSMLAALAQSLYLGGVSAGRTVDGSVIEGGGPVDRLFAGGWRGSRVHSWDEVQAAVTRAGPGATAFVLARRPRGAGHAFAAHHTAEGDVVWAEPQAAAGDRLRQRPALPALEAQVVVVDGSGRIIPDALPSFAEHTSTARALLDPAADHDYGAMGFEAEARPIVQTRPGVDIWNADFRIEARDGTYSLVLDNANYYLATDRTVWPSREAIRAAGKRPLHADPQRILEFVTSPIHVLPGDEGRPDKERVFASLEEALGRLQNIHPNGSAIETLFPQGSFNYRNDARGAVLHPDPLRRPPNLLMHYTAGVPITGLYDFLGHVRDNSRPGHAAVEHLADGLMFGTEIAGEFATATLPGLTGRHIPPFAVDLLSGIEDVTAIRGYLALVYSQVAAVTHGQPSETLPIKARAAAASRTSLASIRQALPDPVKQFIAHNAQHIQDTLLRTVRARRPETNGIDLLNLRQLDESPATIGDYLNNALLPDQPVIDQDKALGVDGHFEQLDTNDGWLDPPLVLIELRKYGAGRLTLPEVRHVYDHLERAVKLNAARADQIHDLPTTGQGRQHIAERTNMVALLTGPTPSPVTGLLSVLHTAWHIDPVLQGLTGQQPILTTDLTKDLLYAAAHLTPQPGPHTQTIVNGLQRIITGLQRTAQHHSLTTPQATQAITTAQQTINQLRNHATPPGGHPGGPRGGHPGGSRGGPSGGPRGAGGRPHPTRRPLGAGTNPDTQPHPTGPNQTEPGPPPAQALGPVTTAPGPARPAIPADVVQRSYPWLPKINPHYAQGGDFATNCLLTAIGTDLTLQEAQLDPDDPDLHAYFQMPPADLAPRQHLLNYGKGEPVQVPGYESIINAMNAAGQGARGLVIVDITGAENGHVFNVVHDHNGIVFLDGQNGEQATLPTHFDTLEFLPTSDGFPHHTITTTPEPRALLDPAADHDYGAMGFEAEARPIVRGREGVDLLEEPKFFRIDARDGNYSLVLDGANYYLATDGFVYSSREALQADGKQLDTSDPQRILEFVTSAIYVLPGDRGRPTKREVFASVAKGLRRLENIHRNGSGIETIFPEDSFDYVHGDARGAVLYPDPLRRSPDLLMHYTAGVPITGLYDFLSHVRDNSRGGREGHGARELLADGLMFGTDIAGGFAATLPGLTGRDIPPFAVDLLSGIEDVTAIRGYLALVYSQIAAVIHGAPSKTLPIKARAAAASRNSLASIRAALPPAVRDYITHNAQDIRNALLRSVRARKPDLNGVDVLAWREKLDESDATIGEYLDNALLPDQPVIDQDKALGVDGHFEQLDTNEGRLDPALVLIELRKYGPAARLTLPEAEQVYDQIERTVLSVSARAEQLRRQRTTQDGQQYTNNRITAVALLTGPTPPPITNLLSVLQTAWYIDPLLQGLTGQEPIITTELLKNLLLAAAIITRQPVPQPIDTIINGLQNVITNLERTARHNPIIAAHATQIITLARQTTHQLQQARNQPAPPGRTHGGNGHPRPPGGGHGGERSLADSVYQALSGGGSGRTRPDRS